MKDVTLAIVGVGAFLGGVFLLTRSARAHEPTVDEPTVVVPTCDDLAAGTVVVEDVPGANAGCGCASCSCGR
jgi:hypothetical protein